MKNQLLDCDAVATIENKLYDLVDELVAEYGQADQDQPLDELQIAIAQVLANAALLVKAQTQENL